MPSEPHPFDRLMPASEFFQRRTLAGCLWSLLGSLTLAKQLFMAYLLFGLLAFGGALDLPQSDRAILESLAGIELAPTQKAGIDEYRDSGLLPLVWHSRQTAPGWAVAAVCRKAPWLRRDIPALTFLTVAIAALHLLRLWFDSMARRTHLKRAMEIVAQLRQAMHRQVLRLGPSDLEGKSRPRAVQLFTEVVDRLRDGLVEWAAVLGRDPLRIVLLVGLVVITDPLLAILCLVPLAGCWALAYFVRRHGESQRQLSLALAEQDQRILSESMTKTQLVKSYGMEAFEQQQFEKSLERYQAQTAAALQSGRGARALIQVAWTASAAGAVFLAGWRQLHSDPAIPFNATLAMAACLAAAWAPMQRLWQLLDRQEGIRESAASLQAWLDLRPEVEQVVGAKFLQPLSRMCEFQNVVYSSGSRKLLDGVTARLPAGKTIALVGTDPLETRAMAAMMPRFIEPQSGRVVFDGEEIAWVTLESLRAETVYVSGQEPYLTGTIRDNLCGGSTFALADLIDAAKSAHAHQFIEKFPQGYETVIGEHGELLDPGQAFRLSLARAILRKPAVLIVEEPWDTLDEETKLLLDDTYKRITRNRTVIFLPSRLGTIRRCDELVFLHKGRVAATGPHAKLVQSSPLYRHWEYIRFNEFRHEFESA